MSVTRLLDEFPSWEITWWYARMLIRADESERARRRARMGMR